MDKIKIFFKDDINAGLGWGVLATILTLTPLPLFQNALLGIMAGVMGFPRNNKAISTGRKLGILGNILCSVPIIYICLVIVGVFLQVKL